MPSPWHDAITQLIEHDPELAVTIARDYLGDAIPSGLPVWLAPSKFNDRPSTDFACDAVVVVGPQRDPVRAIIVEAQRARINDKRRMFAKYAAELWVLLNCPIDVIVICPDEATCDFYAAPFRTSLPGYIHTALPLNPARVPVITDAEQMAKDPGFADLVLAFHADIPGVVEAFARGMTMLGEAGKDYYEYGLSLATDPLRERLEELMAGSFYVSDWGKKAYAEGLAKGRAEAQVEAQVEIRPEALAEGRTQGLAEGRLDGEREAVLLAVEVRKLELTDKERARVAFCEDVDLLHAWLRRAITARTGSEIF